MDLKVKYDKLLDYAERSGVKNLSVRQENNVLYVKGTASATVKDYLWNLYSKIDPDMRSGDMVLDIEVDKNAEDIYEIKAGDSLSKIAARYPGMTWNKIYEANKDVIKDPDKVFPGQKIRIPL